jgi:hypothetical protein
MVNSHPPQDIAIGVRRTSALPVRGAKSNADPRMCFSFEPEFYLTAGRAGSRTSVDVTPTRQAFEQH